MIPHLLTALIAVPALGAIAILFCPRQTPRFLRYFAMAVSLATFGLSLYLLPGSLGRAGFRLEETVSWIPSLGIRYHVGVDGISMWLVLLTTLTTPIALLASWESIQSRLKEYLFSFLLLESAMIGTFLALDLFLFYVFWELMLIPMYLIIGVWGGGRRIYAAVKFFLYTMAGSLLMLAAILYLTSQYDTVAGKASFDYLDLTRLLLPPDTQLWLYLAFALAFAIKVPMWPLHTWLPDAHVEAPTAGSVILAAVLLKMGTYGFLRFAIPLFPNAAHTLGPTIGGLAIAGIILGALVAWRQPDAKKLVAYSSVSHMGFVMLGLMAMTTAGAVGAVLQMLNHGVATGALFLLVGVVYDRRHTRLIEEYGGIAKIMPAYAAVFAVIMLASIGLPGTGGFVGELMILLGTFSAWRAFEMPRLFALLAGTGVILGAVYMLSLYRRMFFGPVRNEANRTLGDLVGREAICLAPLVALVFVMGLYPRPVIARIEQDARQTIEDVRAKQRLGRDLTEARLLEPGELSRTGESIDLEVPAPPGVPGGGQ
ncbi:MAG: NADH-quinone oxidoreductase subunit M [Deltaproteobacteria bacterium]|nr:NADH-quinone oxidoreductase subunit M [Deltaproteobacteria bacterium]